MVLRCCIIFIITAALVEVQNAVPIKRQHSDILLDVSDFSTGLSRNQRSVDFWKQHQREVQDDKPVISQYESEKEMVARSMEESKHTVHEGYQERLRRTPKMPKPEIPQGMPSPPDGMPSPPEGLPSPPDGMPSPPEGMPSPPAEMPKPPEGMPSPPDGMPSPPGEMPKLPEGMPSPPEGMPSPPAEMPKPPEGMSGIPSPPGMG